MFDEQDEFAHAEDAETAFDDLVHVDAIAFSHMKHPWDLERRLASILQDPGFGTLSRVQRLFDRIPSHLDD